MNHQAMASLQQAQSPSRGPFVQARNFAVMTGVNASISCVMKRIREKEDVQSRGHCNFRQQGSNWTLAKVSKFQHFQGGQVGYGQGQGANLMSQGWVCAKQGIEVGGWSVMALEPHHLHLSLRS
ncbi:unnamed protein product [Camellia sinensis]